MAADKGFLERLTGGAGDELAAYQGALQAMSAEGRKGHFARGTAAFEQLLGGVAGGVGGLITGNNSGRSFKGIASNFGGGTAKQQDIMAANAHGISVEELRARRETRKELSKESYVDDGSFEARKKMARKAIEISNRLGDSAGVARGLQTLSEVEDEEQEFLKLSYQTMDEGDNTWYDSSGKPISGTRAVRDGMPGVLVWNHATGQEEFRRLGTDLHEVDPTRNIKPGESLDARLRKSYGRGYVDAARNSIVGAGAMFERFDKMLDHMVQLGPELSSLALDDSAKVVSGVSDLVRNVRSVVAPLIGKDSDSPKTVRYVDKSGTEVSGHWSGRNAWVSRGGKLATKVSIDDPIWDKLDLPEWAKSSSADAQQFRARILDLAYMVARAAEPSNRGLSDNDIEAALMKLGADTANPMVMARRAVEIIGESKRDLDRLVGTFDGFEDMDVPLNPDGTRPYVSRDRILRTLGGSTYPEVDQKFNDLQVKYGYTFNESGRAHFDPNGLLGSWGEYDTNPPPPGSEAVPEATTGPTDSSSWEAWKNANAGGN